MKTLYKNLNLKVLLKQTFALIFLLFLLNGCKPFGKGGDWETSGNEPDQPNASSPIISTTLDPGGDLLVCDDRQYFRQYWDFYLNPRSQTIFDTSTVITKDQIIDSYEISNKFTLNPELLSKTYIENIETITDMLKSFYSDFANTSFDSFLSLKSAVKLKDLSNLVNPDIFITPQNCEMKNIVSTSYENSDFNFTYHELYYNKLSDIEKTILILKNIFVRIQDTPGFDNLTKIEKLAAFLVSEQFLDLYNKNTAEANQALILIIDESFE